MNSVRTDCELAVDVKKLRRVFSGKLVLDEIDLQISSGSIHGLVGLNGAGKTTLIRHLIGSLKAEGGQVRVLGRNPIEEPEGVLKQVGYMTEEDSLPKWMKVGQLIDFCRAIYPNWDERYASELADMFALSRNSSLRTLSKGQRARAGLLVAIAHRPLLLILDEPSSGLDPIARSDILEAVIRTVNQEGRTVLFSSHLLDEVDRACESVSLLHDGKILDTLTQQDRIERYRELIVLPNASWTNPPELPGCFGWRSVREGWSCVIDHFKHGPTQPFQTEEIIRENPVSLQRWFEAKVGDKPRLYMNRHSESELGKNG